MNGSRTYRIGSQVTTGDPFWVLVGEAIEQRALDLPVELVPIDFDLTRLAGDEQMWGVETILAHELDCLIADALNPRLAQEILNARVPLVFAVETPIRHRLCVSPYGLYDVARTAAGYLVEQLGGRGHVLVVGGLVEGAERGQSRLQGSAAVFDRFPALQVTHVPSPWSYRGSHEYVQDAIQNLDGRFDGLFGLSDTVALVAREVAADLGLLAPGCLVTGINGDPLALSAILQGTMLATVDTPAAELGRQILDLAYLAAQGRPLPEHFSYRPRLVNRANVAEVAIQRLIDIAGVPSRLVGINRHLEQARLIQLETNLAINQRVGAILDHKQLRQEIADLIRANYGYETVQVFLWLEATREFVLDTADASAPTIRIPLAASGLLGYTLLNNRPTVVPDMRHSTRFQPDPYWPQTRGRVVVPVRSAGQILGLLDLHSSQARERSPADLVGLQVVGDQLGIAMHNSDLYREAVIARAAAEQASLLKSRLLANVSHELRLPLNIIVGYSEALLARSQAQPGEAARDNARDLRYIYESANQLTRLINDLLDVSRADIGALDVFPERLAPRALLQDVFEQIQGSMPQAAEIVSRLELPADLPAIDADPHRLRQILFNLLSNAYKFTQRGRVTLGARVDPPHLHIWVQDTGSGIAPELQAGIFEAFNTAGQAEPTTPGIGLGLRVTCDLVRLHRGTIRVESAPGMGSTFHVLLPLPGTEAAETPSALPEARLRYSVLPGENEELPPSTSALTRRTVAYLREHYSQSLSRPEIAGLMAVSENYLTRTFRRDLGLTPWQFLNRLRVARARELLAASTLDITEIAGQVGYNDAGYFSRVFRREVGLSPQAYRRQLKRI